MESMTCCRFLSRALSHGYQQRLTAFSATNDQGEYPMIDFGLSGKNAVVSGAGYIPGRAGHGRSCALKLAEAGATVACIDIDRGRAP